MTDITPEPTPGLTRLPKVDKSKKEDKVPTPRGAVYRKPEDDYVFAGPEVKSPAVGTLDVNNPVIAGSDWSSEKNTFSKKTRPGVTAKDASTGVSMDFLFKDPSSGEVYRIVDTYDSSTGSKVLQSVNIDDPNQVLEGSVYIGRRKNGQYFIGRKTDATNLYIDSLNDSKFAAVRNEMMRRGYRGITSSTDKNSDQFYSAVWDLLEIGNRSNFDEFLSKVDSKGYVQLNKLDKTKLEFDPFKVLKSAQVDTAYVSAKTRAATELKAIAYANGMKYDDATIDSWASTVATSGGTTDDYAKRIRTAAAVAFPNFKDQLNAGADLADIASAYIQTASELLELPKASFDLSKPGDVVRKALTSKNDKGAIEPMAMPDFETMVKQDPRWMQTKNAETTFTSLYDSFSRMLGAGSRGAY